MCQVDSRLWHPGNFNIHAVLYLSLIFFCVKSSGSSGQSNYGINHAVGKSVLGKYLALLICLISISK